jgi:beta-alanine degradation protein BauB
MRALAFAVLAIAVSPMSAQDPVSTNPKNVSVVFENEKVRVLRVHYGPHDKLAMHNHPAVAGVRLTASDVRVSTPSGEPTTVHHEAREIFWAAPSQHAVENLADQPIENIEVELKHAAEPAVEVPPQPQASRAAGTEPVPVEQEPHHKIVYQNQYVRMLDVQVNPGESTLFHTHSHDNVAVRLSDATMQNQNYGKEWEPPVATARGAVSFAEGTAKPYTHRIKNTGTTLFHVIDIELMQ